MTEQEINNIISQGEGYHSEFKVSIPSKVRDLTEEICAFANSAGGKLILGVDDQNILHGLTISNAQKSSIQNSINEISPPVDCTIEVYSVENKQIVVIDVKSSNNKPHVFLGVIYVRIGPNTQKLTTAEQMRDFFQQADKIHFDEKPCKEFDVLREFDESHFKEFRSESGMSESIPDDQILRNLQVYAAEDIFKSGAVLFFAKNPEKFFEQAIIRCVSFRGETKRFIDDDKIFVGPLPFQFRQAINWVRGKINVGYDIEGQGSKARVEIWEISESVFKEAIINALAHRDYYEKGAVTIIEVYDDRIEISNPGGLLSAVKGEFGKRSMSRNPLIFGLFARMKLVEKIGSGIPRMKELMLANGLPEPEYNMDGMFSITLRRSAIAAKMSEKMSEKIVKLLVDNKFIRSEEIAQLTGLSKRGVEYQLTKLKALGLISRIGSKKTGFWEVRK